MRLDHIRLVARQELTDLFRNRQVWVGLLVQPLLFIAMFGFIGYVVEQRSAAFETEEFQALVSGSPSDAGAFAQVLRDARFRVTLTDDAERPVVGGDAEVGVVVPSGSADDLDEGRQVRITINYLAGRDQSLVALGRARTALDAFARRQVEERLEALDLPGRLADPIVIEATDIATTDRGARLQLARLIPGLLLFQSSSLVTTAAQRISGSKEKRTFEPLITLPIVRRDLLIGAGLASFVIGLIPAAMFVGPIVIISLLPVAFATGLSSPALVAAGLLIASPLLAAILAALGLAVGTIARTSEGGASVAGAAFVPLFAIGSLFIFVDNLPDAWGWFAVPVYGAALFAREAIAEGVDPFHFVLAAGGALVAAAILVTLAARALDTERSILRAS